PLIGYPLQQRIVPVHYFTRPDDQHAAWCQPPCQLVEQVATAPAPEVDEQVLAEDDIQVPYRGLGQFQDVQPGETYSIAQCCLHAILSILQRLQPALALGLGEPAQAARRKTPGAGLVQRVLADIGGPDAVVAAHLAASGRGLLDDHGQRIGFLTAGTAQAPDR